MTRVARRTIMAGTVGAVASLTTTTYSFSRKGFVATTLFVVADPSGRGSVATVNRP